MPPLLRLALLVAFLGLGCSDREDLDGSRRVPEGSSGAAARPFRPPEAVPDSPIAVDLHASRPTLLGYRRGALVIDAGSAAFAKFVDGGIRRDWHRRLQLTDSKGATHRAAAVDGLAAELYFPLDADPGGIEKSGEGLEIRFSALSAVPNQLVSVFLNEHKLGDLRMETRDWTRYSMRAQGAAVRIGENKLRFYFRTAGTLGDHKSAAAFSQFVIGSSLGDDVAFESKPQTIGDVRKQALVAGASSRISAFVYVPDASSQLRFSFAGKGKAKVLIRSGESNGSKERFSEEASDAHWTEGAVELGSFRGRIVRLDLLSEQQMSWSSLRITESREVEAKAKVPIPDHIILWSVSSLRTDRLRSEVGRAFREFADEGFNIVDAQSNVPSAGGSHATGMTGRMRVRGSIPESFTTLAERLQEAGYATALISGNGFVTDAAGFAQGFDLYDNPMRRQHHFGAKTLWRQASRFLQKHKAQKTFVHVVTVEPHVPYRPSDAALAREWVLPAPFSAAKTLSLAEQIGNGRRVVTQSEQAYIRALYDASVSDAAAGFATMLEELTAIGLRERSAVILSGDHGEEMWERGTFGHGSSLHEESLRSPLVLSVPGLAKGTAPKRGSSMDLMPTVLDIAGLKPSSKLQGSSLLGPGSRLDSRPQLAAASDGTRSIRWGRYKLIHLPEGAIRLYDLESDPMEQEDRSESLPVAARALRNLLATAIAYETLWSASRWGQVSSPTEAFARDQGM